jgi:hypothetical protein
MKASFITYTDAVYFDEINKDNLKLQKYEAVGFLSLNKNKDYVLEYILSENKNSKIVEGLILPRGAVFHGKEKPIKINAKINEAISVEWSDIVHVVDEKIRNVSVMETSGRLIKNNSKFILIENPKTIRKTPSPKKSHPEHSPKYYLIPKSIIKKFIIKK